MIKIGSQFSGVGAFDTALKRLNINFENVYQAEWDKYARKTYLANNEEPEYYVEDVNNTPISEITEKHGSLDIVMFSPPCQAFSLAGKRLGKNDPKGRGILFFNSLEFIEQNKPRFFIFENVKGLLSSEGGDTFNEWLNYLGGKSVNGTGTMFPIEGCVPYHIYWKVLNAKDYGVPQNRERVFIVGIRDDKDSFFNFPKVEPLTKRLKDVLEPEVDEKYYLSEKLISFFKQNEINMKAKGNGFTFKTNKDVAGSITTKAGSRMDDNFIEEPKVIQLNPSKESGGKQPFQQNRVYDVNGIMTTLDTDSGRKNILEVEPKIQIVGTTGGANEANSRIYGIDGISPTLMAGNNGGGQSPVKHLTYDSRIRKLTPIECFRLMDFPDSLVDNARKTGVSDSQLYKQAGNSIVVAVLEKIIKNLKL
jgi:DNA (cytosine-5)-methyltransferase 1